MRFFSFFIFLKSTLAEAEKVNTINVSTKIHTKIFAPSYNKDVLPINADGLEDVTTREFENLDKFVENKCEGYREYLSGKHFRYTDNGN